MAISVKTLLVKMGVDGADRTKAALDDVAARAKRIGDLNPTVDVGADTGAAILKLKAFKAELDAVKAAGDKAAATNLAERLKNFGTQADSAGRHVHSLRTQMSATKLETDALKLAMGGGGGGGLLGAVSSLIGGGGGLAGGVAGGVGLAALAPALVSVAASAAAAGIGLGSFAALAVPTLDKIKTGYTNITAAQLAYNNATTSATRHTALIKLRQDWAALDPAERGAVKGIQGFTAEWDKLAKALQPDVMKVFNEGLKIANQLLPDLLPFARAAAHAIDGLLHGFERFAASAGFKQWLAQMQRLSGPAITTIGTGLGRITIALGKLLAVGASPNGLRVLNAIIDITVGLIDGLSWVINRAGGNLKKWGDIAHQTANKFDEFRHGVAIGLHDIANAFDTTRQTIGVFVAKLDTFFTRTLPAALDILKENVRLRWDQVVTFTLRMVENILHGMSHIPFVGHYFRTAADAVAVELGRMQRDARQASDNINADLGRIHGHHVTLDISGRTIFPGARHAKGTSGAAPGWALVGEEGPELVRMRGGETVLPHPQTVKALRGYAAGTPGFAEVWHPSVAVIGERIAAGAASMERAVEAAARKQLIRSFQTSFAGGGMGGAGVARWAGLVREVLAMLGQPQSDLGVVLRQMATESGGNPRAINLSDINAQRGDPSRGLMQTIGSTFNAYAGPFRGLGIYNPLANIYAGVNYAIHRYGAAWTQVLGHGHGYDSGGYLPPGWSAAYNGTGRPEPVGKTAATTVNVAITVHASPGVDRRRLGQELADIILTHTRTGGRLYPAGVTPR